MHRKLSDRQGMLTGDFPQAGSTEHQIIVRVFGSPEKEMGVQKPDLSGQKTQTAFLCFFESSDRTMVLISR